MKKTGTPSAPQIAKELHDGVCQTLTGVHLQLSVMARKIKKTCPACAADVEELEQLITRAREELQAVLKKVPQ